MLPTGTWDGEQIAKANPNLKFDYMPLPGSDNAEDNKYLGGKYDEPYLLMAKSPNKAAALKWLEFFSSPDMYKEYVAITGGIPTQLNVTTVADYNKTLVANLANFKLEWNNFVASPKGVGKYGAFNITNLVPYGDVNDPKELAQKAQTDWDAALRK